MIAFEKYLIEIGYTPYRYNSKTQQLEPTTKINPSSMENMRYMFKKDGCIDFITGLDEKGKPPTLIYPRPTIKGQWYSKPNQDEMEKLFAKYTCEQIYDAIVKDKLLTL